SRTRLPPKRSPSHPEAGMNTARLTRKAIEMLLTAVGVTPKSRPMVGSATLTIVASMIDMNMAATNTTLTATFWLMRDSTSFLSWLSNPGDWYRRRRRPTQAAHRPASFRIYKLIRMPEHSGQAVAAAGGVHGAISGTATLTGHDKRREEPGWLPAVRK